jgi:hypothetical protein
MLNQMIPFFKAIEPLFWLAQIWIVADLINPKYFFGGKLKVVNWLLRKQGFETQLPLEEKALNVWLRDLKILFVLDFLVIGLIHLI